MSFGIESGSDETLKTIRKHATVADNLRALTIGRQHGICTRGTMIVGMPEEKFENALDSIFFNVNSGVGPQDLRISLKTFIFPGTFWEKWFREKHPDFSWGCIPDRFKNGSILDTQGNVALPCYRWRGLAFCAVFLLRTAICFRAGRWLLSSRLIQRVTRTLLCWVVGRGCPKSVPDR